MAPSLSPAARALEARVAAYFRERGLSLSAPALLGLSGGPDSTALLALLSSLGAGPLRAFHVDHGIRPEAERAAELELLRGLCARLGVPLGLARVRPGAVRELAASSGEGLEAAARRYRRAAFRRALSRRGLSRLYLGHTRDDRLETILMRLLGGSGAGGIAGLAPEAPPLYRPLIGLPKAALLAYLEERGLPHSLDSTNADESILRNRLRARLLPLLSADFPGWERGLELAAEKALRDEEALEALAAGLRARELGPGRLGFEAEALLAAPEALGLRALVSGLGRLGKGGRASSRLARAALEAAGRGGLYRGGGLELRREGGLLCLSKALDFRGRGGYFVAIDRPGEGAALLRAGRLRAAVAWVEGPGAEGIKEAAFSFPLILRSRRPGDSLSLRSGTKPIDELLSEWGLQPALRDATPILEDREGIVAVLGKAFGGRDRYRHREGLPEGGRRLSIAVKGA